MNSRTSKSLLNLFIVLIEKLFLETHDVYGLIRNEKDTIFLWIVSKKITFSKIYCILYILCDNMLLLLRYRTKVYSKRLWYKEVIQYMKQIKVEEPLFKLVRMILSVFSLSLYESQVFFVQFHVHNLISHVQLDP